jgi:tRNA-modifying protein YgfZ
MPVDTDSVAQRSGDVARILLEPALVPLESLGVLSVSGADAVAFLQSQLTNDVAGLAADAMQLNGYCTAKGRLLATFHQWRHGDDILLRLPRAILPAVLKRLSMFVLRAKVKITDASAAWTTHAVLGPDLSKLAQQAGVALPAAAWTGLVRPDGRIDRVPAADGVEHRLLLTTPADGALPAWLDALPRAPEEAWWWTEIAAAVPTVFAATQEKFVPQMINFEVLGGVSFRKGCYPGQEIVARSQYLGKLKRRMNIAHVDGGGDDAGLAAGADVFHADGAQPVGTVVMSAASPHGGTDLLFEVPIDRLDTGTLHVGAADGPRLAVKPLPYALFDPTA